MLDFLKRLLYHKKRKLHTPREYEFPLPYLMTATLLFYGVSELQKEGIFSELPQDIQDKMLKARASWHSLRIKAEDLDRIDDETWAKIAAKLNLKWKKKGT